LALAIAARSLKSVNIMGGLMRRLWCAFVIMLAFAATSAAQSHACVPIERLTEHARSSEIVREVRVLAGDQIATAAEFFHASPPEDDSPIDLAVLVIRADGGAVLFVGTDGVICGRLPISAPYLDAFLRMLDGTPI
jgi:hypothetical protein